MVRMGEMRAFIFDRGAGLAATRVAGQSTLKTSKIRLTKCQAHPAPRQHHDGTKPDAKVRHRVRDFHAIGLSVSIRYEGFCKRVPESQQSPLLKFVFLDRVDFCHDELANLRLRLFVE